MPIQLPSEIVSIQRGLSIFRMEADCQSETKPTAELWINYGKPFYSGNIKKVMNLNVNKGDSGLWTANANVVIPSVKSVPFLMPEKRWIVFRNKDGITKGPEFQIQIE